MPHAARPLPCEQGQNSVRAGGGARPRNAPLRSRMTDLLAGVTFQKHQATTRRLDVDQLSDTARRRLPLPCARRPIGPHGAGACGGGTLARTVLRSGRGARLLPCPARPQLRDRPAVAVRAGPVPPGRRGIGGAGHGGTRLLPAARGLCPDAPDTRSIPRPRARRCLRRRRSGRVRRRRGGGRCRTRRPSVRPVAPREEVSPLPTGRQIGSTPTASLSFPCPLGWPACSGRRARGPARRCRTGCRPATRRRGFRHRGLADPGRRRRSLDAVIAPAGGDPTPARAAVRTGAPGPERRHSPFDR
jgi:hypothetical protein